MYKRKLLEFSILLNCSERSYWLNASKLFNRCTGLHLSRLTLYIHAHPIKKHMKNASCVLIYISLIVTMKSDPFML